MLFAFAIRFRAGRWANAASAPDLDHAVRRLSREDLCLEEHSRPRRHHQWQRCCGLGIIDEPLDAVHLQRKWRRHHPHLFPAALRHPADLRQHARHSRQPDRGGARSRRLRLSGRSRRRAASIRARHQRGLPVDLPDLGRRLRDAALRGWRSIDDGSFHRDAVLVRLQLADGKRHVVHADGVLRSLCSRYAARRCAAWCCHEGYARLPASHGSSSSSSWWSS